MFLSEINERGYKFFILFYMLIAILAFNIWYAFGWVTYGGPGIGELVYTPIGRIGVMRTYLTECLLGFGVFMAKMIFLYRQKEKLRTYLLYMLACISSIVLGTIIFYLDINTVQFIWKAVGINLIRIISVLRWVDVLKPPYI